MNPALTKAFLWITVIDQGCDAVQELQDGQSPERVLENTLGSLNPSTMPFYVATPSREVGSQGLDVLWWGLTHGYSLFDIKDNTDALMSDYYRQTQSPRAKIRRAREKQESDMKWRRFFHKFSGDGDGRDAGPDF